MKNQQESRPGVIMAPSDEKPTWLIAGAALMGAATIIVGVLAFVSMRDKGADPSGLAAPSAEAFQGAPASPQRMEAELDRRRPPAPTGEVPIWTAPLSQGQDLPSSAVAVAPASKAPTAPTVTLSTPERSIEKLRAVEPSSGSGAAAPAGLPWIDSQGMITLPDGRKVKGVKGASNAPGTEPAASRALAGTGTSSSVGALAPASPSGTEAK